MIIQKDPAALEESVQQDGAQYQPPPPSYTELSYPHIQQPEPAHPSPGVPSPNQYPPNPHNQSNSSPSAAPAPTPLSSHGEAGRLYREERMSYSRFPYYMSEFLMLSKQSSLCVPQATMRQLRLSVFVVLCPFKCVPSLYKIDGIARCAIVLFPIGLICLW
jgi:hypothetical protein